MKLVTLVTLVKHGGEERRRIDRRLGENVNP